MSKIFPIAAIGIISSIFCFLYVQITSDVFWGPGFIFGALISWHFKKNNLGTLLLFSVISTAAYYTAVYIMLSSFNFFNRNETIPSLLAGSVGAFIFLSATHFFL